MFAFDVSLCGISTLGPWRTAVLTLPLVPSQQKRACH